MNKITLLLILLTSTFGCDDQEKPTTEPTLRDATVDESSAGDSDLDVEYYDFDTISIEPDRDLGPDIDDESE